MDSLHDTAKGPQRLSRAEKREAALQKADRLRQLVAGQDSPLDRVRLISAGATGALPQDLRDRRIADLRDLRASMTVTGIAIRVGLSPGRISQLTGRMPQVKQAVTA